MPLAAEHGLRAPTWAFRLRARLYRMAAARELRRRRRNRTADVFVVSFPKAGRTWLRVLLGGALIRHFDLEASVELTLWRLADLAPGIPRIRFTHDDLPQWKTPDQLVHSKTEFRDRKVILLVRDLRDLVVSAFFQASRRQKAYDGDLRSFVYHPAGSLASMLRFYNDWADQRDVPSGLLLLRYEDLHQDPVRELRRVLDFVGVTGVSEETLSSAVEDGRFENMRRLEQRGELDSAKLRPADRDDPESFKTRRGKVGGFVDYLEDREIRLIREKMKSELSDFYRY